MGAKETHVGLRSVDSPHGSLLTVQSSPRGVGESFSGPERLDYDVVDISRPRFEVRNGGQISFFELRKLFGLRPGSMVPCGIEGKD